MFCYRRQSVRKIIPLSFLCAASMFHLACSSETHYDSISTVVTVDVTKAVEADQKVKAHHRFQFDRDLGPLQSMDLVEAWLDTPTVMLQEGSVTDGDPFNLGIIRDMGISIVDQNNGTKVFWLYVTPTPSTLDKARFSELNVGDLRGFMTSAMKFEIEVNITLDTYQAMRYWRDICQMEEKCNVQLPFSMQFKMDD